MEPDALPAASLPDLARDYMAAHPGVTRGEATRRVALERAAARLQARLDTAETGNFAGLYIQHTPTFRVVARFKNNPQAALQRHVAAFGLGADAQSDQANYSMQELNAAVRVTVDALKSAGVEYQVGIDPRRNALFIVVTNRAVYDALVAQGRINAAIVAEVSEVATIVPREASFYGGINATSCTVGFTVFSRSTPSVRGVTTAGHCSAPQSAAGQSLSRMNEIDSGLYDLEWHVPSSGSHTWYGYVNLRNGGYQAIHFYRPMAQMAAGQTACISGLTSGYRCGQIYAININTSSLDGGVWVTNSSGLDMSGGGDSGAPWFSSDIALGSHVGAPNSSWPNDAFFMPIERISVFDLGLLAAP